MVSEHAVEAFWVAPSPIVLYLGFSPELSIDFTHPYPVFSAEQGRVEVPLAETLTASTEGRWYTLMRRATDDSVTGQVHSVLLTKGVKALGNNDEFTAPPYPRFFGHL